MMSLLEAVASQPLASLGLLSLCIPILIHLFNPNRGRKVLIGNIRLIAKLKHKRVTQIKIRQWLLLMTRLVFLVLLTLILIALLIPNDQGRQADSAVFITKGWLKSATQTDKRILLDQHNGSDIYLMAEGWPKIDSIEGFTVKANTKATQQRSLDSLLSDLVISSRLAQTNHVYYAPSMDSLSNSRNPVVQSALSKVDIHWIPSGKTANQIQPIEIVLLYDSERAADQEAIQTAINQLSEIVKGRSFNYRAIAREDGNKWLDSLENLKSEVPTLDWYIWLSSDVPPAGLLDKIIEGSYLFSENHQLKQDHQIRQQNIVGNTVDFFHPLASITKTDEIAVWRGRRNLLLSYKPLGKGKHYQFHSQLSLKANTILNTPKAVDFFGQLFELKELENLQQPIVPINLQLYKNSKLESNLLSLFSFHDHRDALIFLLVLVWILERVLSESKRTRND